MANCKAAGCGGQVVGAVTVTVNCPINQKGGGLNLAGISVKQADLKAVWEGLAPEERVLACDTCGTVHNYVPGKGLMVMAAEGAIAEAAEEVQEEVEAPAPAPAPVRRPMPMAKPAPAPAPAPVARPAVKPVAKPAPVARPMIKR